MQLIRDVYAAKAARGQPVISFEFFPPKTEEGGRNLLEKTIPALLETRPDYCSVTYGAGGSTREKTLMIVERIQREHGLTAVAHLTCVSATKEQIGDLLNQIRSLGVKNVLALRGDPPNGGDFQMTPGGFEYSSQLVRFIREQDSFSIGVREFPRRWPQDSRKSQTTMPPRLSLGSNTPRSNAKNCWNPAHRGSIFIRSI